MSTIVATTTTVTGSFQLVETALTANDILTYVVNKGQQLNIRNPTTSSVTVIVKGTAPISPIIPGAGQIFSTTGGYSLIVTAQSTQCINLDRISNYVAGTTTAVAVSNGLGCFGSILQP